MPSLQAIPRTPCGYNALVALEDHFCEGWLQSLHPCTPLHREGMTHAHTHTRKDRRQERAVVGAPACVLMQAQK